MFDRHTVLENALILFWQRGFAASSLRQLEAATSLNPGSIYYHFSNKESLFLATLEHYIDNHLQTRLTQYLQKSPPMDGLRRFMTSGYRHNTEDRFKNCCYLARACIEINLLPSQTTSLINQGLDLITEGFKAHIRHFNNTYCLKNPVDDSTVPQQLLNLYLSLQLLAQTKPNQHFLDKTVTVSLQQFFPTPEAKG